ncbi:MAG: LysR substrate-binding domain-containing protein [Solirubrobacteraceae bacterium]
MSHRWPQDTLNEEFLSGAGLSPETLTLGSNGAIKQAARIGLGVSILSREAVDVELHAGVLTTLAVEGLPPPGRWFALTSAVGPERPAVDAFVAHATSA